MSDRFIQSPPAGLTIQEANVAVTIPAADALLSSCHSHTKMNVYDCFCTTADRLELALVDANQIVVDDRHCRQG
jgi:hypothetical protein